VRQVVVGIVVLAVAVLLVVGFVRALPEAMERQKQGRIHRIKALCDEPLHAEPANRKLGMLPVDAPGFEVADWAGRKISLDSLRGRAVLLNFWATWCQTCVVEMPSLERLADAEKRRPITFLAVSVDENWDVVRKFFAGGSKLTVALDVEKKLPTQYGTDKFPETFLIDKDGRVLYYVVSDRDWSTPEMKACMEAIAD
jgi:thiol-disulfide isomerase/thioredoxin